MRNTKHSGIPPATSRRAALVLTLSIIVAPAAAQTQMAPGTAGALEDPRVDVGGENPVYARSRIILSYDWQDLEGDERLDRVRLRLLSPFGAQWNYSWQLELPYERLSSAEGVTYGLSDIGTRLNWVFYRTPQLRQNVGLNVQWQTARDRRLSDNATLLQPQYAFSYARSETFVINAQFTYSRSVERDPGAPRVNRIALEPSVTFLLPDSWSCNLATRLTWNFERDKLAATLRGTLGFVLGARQEWELDAFVEHALTDLAKQTQFENRVGIDLVRYF